jgi:hypothetical protein
MLGGIGEKIFGGTDNSAQKEQIRANKRAQEFIEQQTGLAIQDIAQLYPMGEQFRNDAYNQAMGLMGASALPQMSYFQQGNVGAQNALIGAMPQYQNALFGNPVDYSQFQPVQFQMPSPSAFQAQLPQMQEARGPWASLAYDIANRQAAPVEEPDNTQKMLHAGANNRAIMGLMGR